MEEKIKSQWLCFKQSPNLMPYDLRTLLFTGSKETYSQATFSVCFDSSNYFKLWTHWRYDP